MTDNSFLSGCYEAQGTTVSMQGDCHKNKTSSTSWVKVKKLKSGNLSGGYLVRLLGFRPSQ